LSLYVKLGKNKGNNRNSLDIVRDMLSAASVSVRKTRIMYQASLSFVQVEKYLHTLLEKGLLTHDGDSCYLITKKGLDFVRLYDEYVEQCRLIREQVDRSVRNRLFLEDMCSRHEPVGERNARKKMLLPEL
jgi:predicted transcriptional regulator